MAAQPRKLSASGIYHVMLRGINQTQLFYEDEDRHAFIERLGRFEEGCGFGLMAYSLMGNHVHLLIKAGEAGVSLAVKRLALSYSHWFNAKYDRGGYLFQGRLKSEPVEGGACFLAALRCIHNNPVEAGEPLRHWASYDAYLSGSTLVDAGFALAVFSDDTKKAGALFCEFMGASPGKGPLAYLGSRKGRMPDGEAAGMIKRVGEVEACNKLAGLGKDRRNQVLAELKKSGLTIRRVARLSGINRGVVQKAGE